MQRPGDQAADVNILVAAVAEKRGSYIFTSICEMPLSGARTIQRATSTLTPKSVPSLGKEKDLEKGERPKFDFIPTKAKNPEGTKFILTSKI